MSDQPVKQFKDMSGYLAKNTKRTKDSQPHLTGKIRVRGEELLISVWEKDGKPDLMSVSITDPKSLPARPQSQGASNQGASNQGSQGGSSPQASGGQTGDKADDMFGDLFGSLGA